jgi:hypothetical protein
MGNKIAGDKVLITLHLLLLTTLSATAIYCSSMRFFMYGSKRFLVLLHCNWGDMRFWILGVGGVLFFSVESAIWMASGMGLVAG